jgi:hypothetical protein
LALHIGCSSETYFIGFGSFGPRIAPIRWLGWNSVGPHHETFSSTLFLAVAGVRRQLQGGRRWVFLPSPLPQLCLVSSSSLVVSSPTAALLGSGGSGGLVTGSGIPRPGGLPSGGTTTSCGRMLQCVRGRGPALTHVKEVGAAAHCSPPACSGCHVSAASRLTATSSAADPESFHWVGIQYRNSAPQYATVLATVLRYLGRRESGVVLGLPKTRLGPPLTQLGHLCCFCYSTEATMGG